MDRSMKLVLMKYTIELVGTVLNGRDVVKTREKRFAEDTNCRT